MKGILQITKSRLCCRIKIPTGIRTNLDHAVDPAFGPQNTRWCWPLMACRNLNSVTGFYGFSTKATVCLIVFGVEATGLACTIFGSSSHWDATCQTSAVMVAENICI